MDVERNWSGSFIGDNYFCGRSLCSRDSVCLSVRLYSDEAEFFVQYGGRCGFGSTSAFDRVDRRGRRKCWALVRSICLVCSFFWQLPHFAAINWMYREEYCKGGFVMWSNHDESGRKTARLALLFSICLLGVASWGGIAQITNWDLFSRYYGLECLYVFSRF